MKRMLLLVLLVISACSGKSDPNNFSEAVNGATSANIAVNVPFQNANIQALNDSGALVEGSVEVIGDFDFDTSGTTERQISISEDTRNRLYSGSRILEWDVNVNPSIPTQLDVDIGSGEATLQLDDLSLTELTLDVDSGEISATLPLTEEPLDLGVSVGNGSANLTVPDGFSSVIDLNTESGQIDFTFGEDVDSEITINIRSGAVSLDLRPDTEMMVELFVGNSGNIHLLDNLIAVEQDGESGVWVTPGFDEAEHQVIIRVSVSLGSFEIR